MDATEHITMSDRTIKISSHPENEHIRFDLAFHVRSVSSPLRTAGGRPTEYRRVSSAVLRSGRSASSRSFNLPKRLV